MHIVLFQKGWDPSRNITVRLENLTAVFKSTDSMTTASCRRFVGASVILYHTARSMILEDGSGCNRGEYRDDDDIRISNGVNTPNSLERTRAFNV
jgi:hypothetical protein